MTPKSALPYALLVFFVLLFAGCGPGDTRVGAECGHDRDCAPESKCVEDDDFPGGMCTLSCRNNSDCPDHTACIDKKGGICLLRCEADIDCPRRWDCERKELEGTSGKQRVCIDD